MRQHDIPALTGLRAIAAWWVVGYHFRSTLQGTALAPLMQVLAGGFVAVDIFFVLSGFVLTLKYFNTFVDPPAGAWRHFMARRLARIYPLHLVILLVYLLNPLALYFFSRSGTVGGGYDASYFVLSLLLVQNWGFTDALQWNVPAWSISVEMLAYCVFPVLVWLVHGSERRGAATMLWLVLGACVLLSGAYFALRQPTLADGIEQLGGVRCLCGFVVGMVLARLHMRWPQAVRRHAPRALLVAVPAVALCMAAQLPDHVYVPLASAVLILWLATSPRGVAPLLGSRWLVGLGTVSYSTYLVHYFIKDWVKFLSAAPGLTQFVIYLVAVAAASLLLYRYVEVPGRQLLESRLHRWETAR